MKTLILSPHTWESSPPPSPWPSPPMGERDRAAGSSNLLSRNGGERRTSGRGAYALPAAGAGVWLDIYGAQAETHASEASRLGRAACGLARKCLEAVGRRCRAAQIMGRSSSSALP